METIPHKKGPRKGRLYLLPVSMGEDAMQSMPEYVVERIHQLEVFIVERARTARRFIAPTRPPRPISEMTFLELDKRRPHSHLREYLQHALDGKDMGLMSEAGCPGVADPGALVVRMAHELGITVVPLVGPSSILLSLMASGMDGQRFCFHGYLPISKPERSKAIQRLEKDAIQYHQTQIFIETPYRNDVLLQELLQLLQTSTRLCVASELTTSQEYVASMSVQDWRQAPTPDLHKRPTVFLIGK